MRLVSSNSRRFSRGRGVGVLGDFGGGDLLGSVAKQLADLNEETEGAAQRLRERNYRRIAESKGGAGCKRGQGAGCRWCAAIDPFRAAQAACERGGVGGGVSEAV